MSPSGEPIKRRGRPPGVGAVARLRRELFADGGYDELVKRTRELAQQGNPAALRILWERAVPPPRAHAELVRVDLPNGSLTDQAKALLAAATDGRIPADIAAQLIGALASITTIEQGDELRRQVDELFLNGIA